MIYLIMSPAPQVNTALIFKNKFRNFKLCRAEHLDIIVFKNFKF